MNPRARRTPRRGRPGWWWLAAVPLLALVAANIRYGRESMRGVDLVTAFIVGVTAARILVVEFLLRTFERRGTREGTNGAHRGRLRAARRR